VSRKLPTVKLKLVIRALQRYGFIVHHTTGSHYALKKDNKRLWIPYHNKDMKPGKLASGIKRGWAHHLL